MTSESHPEALAKAYVLRRQALAIQERQLTRNMLPPEEQLQIMWLEGLLGNELYDAEGHKINILEFGHWNRGAGPDFLNARIQVNDKIIQGDIELDISPEDWEEHHHGSNGNFDQVILHVVCLPPRQIWYTRTSQHKTVPWALVSQDHLINVLALPKVKQFMPLPGHCASMFLVMSRNQLEQTLLAAAAYRNELKKKTWQALVAAVGPQQALYEQTAEALGFHANKAAMHQLAKRVPLNKAQEYPEALLFGTAGFLSSNLPESCSEETRAYHKELWSVWWRFRDQFELAPERSISWIFSGIRPVNHPQRRLAALAALILRFDTFYKLCSMARFKELEQFLIGLQHPYWNYHATLTSKRQNRHWALFGKERIGDFIVNTVLPMNPSPEAWNTYLKIRIGQPSSVTINTAERLLGKRSDVDQLLRYAWVQQALLQINIDFCRDYLCSRCPLPEQAPQWGLQESQ